MKRIVICTALVLGLAGGLLAAEFPASAAKKPHHPTSKKVVIVRGPRGRRGPRGLQGPRGVPGVNGTDGTNGETGPSVTEAAVVGSDTEIATGSYTTLATLTLNANTDYLITASVPIESGYDTGNAEVDCQLTATNDVPVGGDNRPYVVNAAGATTDLSAFATVASLSTTSTLTLSCEAFEANQETGLGDLIATEVGSLSQS